MSLRNLKILMIEDNQDDAELAMRHLKRHSVTHVKSLKDGIAALENGKFDCVLLDLHMVNGRKDTILYEVNMKRGNAATVILTGDDHPRTREHMMYIGADHFMVKGKDDKSADDMNYVLAVAIEHRKGRPT